MTNLEIHDTLTDSKKQLLTDKKIRIYLCGVTVYDDAHIGHARTIIIFDTLRRFLEANGIDVDLIQNFTDVDDKIIKKASEINTTADLVSAKYIENYLDGVIGGGPELYIYISGRTGHRAGCQVSALTNSNKFKIASRF